MRHPAVLLLITAGVGCGVGLPANLGKASLWSDSLRQPAHTATNACLSVADSEQAQLESIVRDLNSERIEDREFASQRLLARGERIRDRLEELTRDANPEISGRAHGLLEALDRRLSSLAIVIGRLLGRQQRSEEELLRVVTKLVKRACEGKTFVEVARTLGDQGLDRITDGLMDDRGVAYRIPWPTSNVATSVRCDLVVTILNAQEPRAEVKEVSVALRMRGDLTTGSFAAGTVLSECLVNPLVVDAASRLGTMREVMLAYRDTIHEDSEVIPPAFYATVALESPDRQNGEKFILAAGNEDDAIRVVRGPSRDPQCRTRRAELRCVGGLKWWSNRSSTASDGADRR